MNMLMDKEHGKLMVSSHDYLNVEGDVGDEDFDVARRKLRPKAYNVPVHGDERAPVVVEPATVAALLIGVEIHPAGLGRRATRGAW